MPEENLADGPIFFRKTWQVTCFVLTIFMMVITNANAQANSYAFSQSNGTYVPITDGTVIISSTNGTPNLDSYASTTQTIPSFTFSGVAYTSMRVTSNGQLSLGTTAPSEYSYTVLSTNTGGNIFLAPFSADLDDNTGVSEIRFETVANEIVVQWKNFKRYGKTESFNFQVRMNTSNGTIKFVYDGTPPFAVSADYQPQVGIKSGVGVYNFLTVPATGSWNTPVNGSTGILDTSICTFNGAIGFTSGLTYTWTAPTCIVPSAIVASNLTSNSATISWTAPSPVPSTGYQYEIRTSGAAGSGATGLLQSGSTAAGVVTQNITGLTANTSYSVYVRSACDAGTFSSWSGASAFFTGYCTPPVATGTGTYINNFSTTLGSINISNFASGFSTTGYKDNYSTMEVTSYAEGIVNYSLSMVGGTAGIAIWVDWNNNLVFETSERLYNSAAYLAAGTYTGSITVPAGMTMGSYRMRVKTDFSSSNPDPCTNGGTRAETEDYKFTVGVAPSCLPPTAIVATLITNNSATIGWTASSSTPSSGYQYEVRTSGAAGSGATGLATSGSVTAVTVPLTTLAANTTYTIYVRSDCGSGLYSNWSAAATFTTQCDAVTAFSENFNAVTTPGFPACWGKVGTNGTANTQNTDAASTPNTLYMYSSSATSRAVVKMQPVSNAGANTHRLRFKLRGNFSPGETVEVGYLTNPSDATTFVVLETYTAATTSYVQKILEPTTAPGANQVLAFRTGTAMLSVLIDDVVWELNPTDVVDNANLQSFIVNAATVTSLETCQSFDVTARALETGLTEAAGQAAGLVAHVGYSTTNTDPATWPESAWKVATFNADVDNTDEFKATFTPLAAGTYYFASRFVLNGGPAKYGATNNGFWNTATNPNATITVSAPAAVTAVAATPSFCAGGSTSITASSANTAMTYLWSEGSTTAIITVSPMTTTTYTVTATNPATGCTSTATVTVAVNSAPAAVVATPDTVTVCEGQSVAIAASTAPVDMNVQFGAATTASTTTTYPNPFSAWYGGVKNQMLYTQAELTAQGLVSGSEIKSVSFDIAAFVANQTCNDFRIRIGNTTVATLTALVPSTSLTTVYNTTFTPSATGFVTFTFTAPFTWDGTSNIVIETVHNAGNGGNGAGATVRYTATSFASCFHGAKDSVTPAGAASFDALTTWTNTGSSSNRPNAKFSVESTPAITWTPVTNLFTDVNATVAYVAGTPATMVYAKPSETTTYTATAAIGTCTSSDNAVITVNELPDAPTGAATQAATTIADIVVTPATGVTWYPTQADAVAGTNALASNFAVVDGATYYATVSNECTSLPLAVTIDFALSSPSFNMNKLKYYPNPVNNVLTVSYNQEITGLKLYNMVGQQLMVKKVKATETQLDMSNLPAGSYLLEVSSGANSKTVKLLKNQ